MITENNIVASYILSREDNKNARFYWMRENEIFKKYIGITSLASICLPDSEELIRWQLQKDPDGRLLELSANHGTLEHTIIHNYDMGLDWRELIKDYQYERMILGSVIAWKKFCEDFEVEILASEIMLKYELNGVKFACTLDKVVYLTKTVKEIKEVEIGVYKSGKRKGQPKFIKQTGTEKVKTLAIIDLKSNFFEKDSKTFYESHQFQLHGQKLAFQQSFPELTEPLLFNWSPNNWRTRTGNFDNLYTFFQHKNDYSEDFNEYMHKAIRKCWLEPKGKIEVFMPFDNKTPLSESYKVMDYQEFIEWKESEREKAEKESKIEEKEIINTTLFNN